MLPHYILFQFLNIGTIHTYLAVIFFLLCHPATSEPGLESEAGETQNTMDLVLFLE